MKLNIRVTIEVPNQQDPVEMTPAQLLHFHDELTKFINRNYEALTNENLPD
jgi:menaquinone-dependent protoporphyrinogen IX oxidase